ncbi:hypothetical protein LNKW23_36930 [Paralimibaculum aggregatum]|uniref:Caspase family p20 domain-containing protein n=1 Tax=Paralimibaculum aggregatum TaxID=3036245 RepID=A0ABQ6LN96_9RHOB|nr:caspase family protein [Limibaculum sp. NKW23]GMG84477.1 hypothetical protein LNKW23_36930 [Limibaculum sp. NKW23]
MRFSILLLPLLGALLATPLAAAERIALVIGNAAYAHTPRLSNPARDSAAIAAALEAAGFAVTRAGDADFDTMRQALAGFRRAATEAEVAVIYFAGHGLEVNRTNYLLPVDADPREPGDLVFHGLRLDTLRRAVRPARRLSLVILDACRDNPFVARMAELAGSRSLGIGRGLGRADEAGENELVAYAAKEGTIAQDGVAGGNSPYAAALALKLREPGLEINQLFREVYDEVVLATGGRQEPAVYGSLSAAAFYFVPAAPVPEPEPDPAAAPPAGPQLEAAYVTAIAGSEDPRDYEEYLARWPEGFFAGVARRRLEGFAADMPGSDPEPAAPVPGGGGQRVAAVQPDAPAAMPGGTEEDAADTPASGPDTAFRPDRAQIREAQARLNILGLDAGPPDGVIGPRMRAAIAAFQQRKRLAVSGEFDSVTFAALQADRLATRKLAAYLAGLETAQEAEPAAPEAPGGAGPVPPPEAGAGPPVTPAGPSELFATTGVNLRAGPGTGHPVIGALQRNQRVTVVGRSADGVWRAVRVQGREAFVHGSYLSPRRVTSAPRPERAEPAPTAAPPASRTQAIVAAPGPRPAAAAAAAPRPAVQVPVQRSAPTPRRDDAAAIDQRLRGGRSVDGRGEGGGGGK